MRGDSQASKLRCNMRVAYGVGLLLLSINLIAGPICTSGYLINFSNDDNFDYRNEFDVRDASERQALGDTSDRLVSYKLLPQTGIVASESNINYGDAIPDISAILKEDKIPAASVNGDEEEEDEYRSKDEIYILEDKDYPKSLFEHYQGVGQVSGITTLPSGDVAIFHRADREWDDKTFMSNHSLTNWQTAQDNLIRNNTIMIIDRENGGSVTCFGSNLFYMPHNIASDNEGNLWITDVGRHQVMRLPTSMVQIDHLDPKGEPRRWLPGNMTRIWPDIILGEAFVPGDDDAHFCQPSEVAVSSDGRLVFVADGYCNKRVMVFTGTGKFLTSFGEQQGFNIVHSLTLIEERNLVCVADRENGRIICFKAGLDGNLDSIGEPIMNVHYPLGRVFAIVSLDSNHLLVSSNQYETSRFDLAALNPFKSELKQIWTSSDLLVPHSLARTRDGHHAYAADISRDAYKKVFKFNIIERKSR